MRRRVVITGMGCITPLGHNVQDLFDGLIAGRSGVGPIFLFNAARFPTKFASQVKDFDLARYVSDPKRWVHSGPNSRFGAAAAHQALTDSGLIHDTKVDRSRLGVYVGAGEGIQDFHHFVSLVARTYQPDKRAVDASAFNEGGLREFHPGREFEQELHTTSAHLAAHFNLEGPNLTCLTACAASSQAIGEAAWLIRQGDADIMLSGGSHSMIHPFGLTGFNLLTALSRFNEDPIKASRPFDMRRDGFVLGEGSGMLVLEELEHARRRRAHIYGELTGYGSTCDAFAVTDSHPEGRGAIACIKEAMKDAALSPEAIGYVNAHGTSTRVNDRVETMAIKTAFGEHAYNVPVSSSKSMLGHLIAAAGAVELIISTMTVQRGVLPPTINYETPDPDCDLDYIPNTPREKCVRNVLSNSFGFGGQNISLIVSKFEG